MLLNRKSRASSSTIRPVTLPVVPPISAPTWGRHVAGSILVAVWAAVLLGAPAWLPMQAASWMTFIGLFIMPGYLLGSLVTHNLDLDWIERFALSFPLGITVLTLPGMAALLLHWTIADLATAWTVTTLLVVAVWAGFQIWLAVKRPATLRFTLWPADDLAMLVLLAAGFMAMLPALTLYKIDGDALAVGSFAADALAGLPLNLHEPLFGSDLGPGVRMAFNQTLPMAYLWSYWSGIEPMQLTGMASRAMIGLWIILSTYMLGKAAGADIPSTRQGRRMGLLVAAVQMLIYLSGPFLRGDNVALFFFERTTADKFMVPTTMVPVIAALAIYYVRHKSLRIWLAAALACIAVSAIHPLIAAMLALALGAFGAVHLLLHLRNRDALRRVVAIWALAGLVMILPVVQLVISRGEAPLAASYPQSVQGWPVGYKLVPALPFLYVPTLDVYGPLPDLSQLEAIEAEGSTNPFLIWRFAVNMNRRRLLLFNLDQYISDPNLVLEPPYLLALLLLPLLLFNLRRNLAAQYAIGTSAAILVVMFNPLLTPLLGSLVMPWILWRFVWLLPYALVIGLALEPLLRIAGRAFAQLAASPIAQRTRASLLQKEQIVQSVAPVALVLAGALVLSPIIARNLQRIHERAAYPYFYPAPEQLLGKLDELTASEPATVLANQDLSVSIPAYVANAHIVAHRIPTTSEIFPADRQTEALQRLIDQDTFFRTRLITAETVRILQNYDVGFVVTHSGSNLDIQLRLAPNWFEWLLDDQSFSLYAVRMVPGITDTIQGNTDLAGRRWDDAASHYERALKYNADDIMALMGLAEIAHAKGRFNDALSYYRRTLEVSDLPAVRYRQGQLYTELGQTELSVAEFDRAQQAAPRVARFHVAMGDACLSMGDETCAAEQYALAVENENLPDRAARIIALADLWRQRGRTDLALAHYEEAASLQPSEANQLMLASAYLEQNRFDQAEALLRLLRFQHPLSAEVIELLAQVETGRGNYGNAIQQYRRAVWLLDLTGQVSVETRLALANTMREGGQLKSAQRELQYALSIEPNNATAYGLQGQLYDDLHMVDDATLAYQRAFRLDPTQVQFYLALSNQFRRQNGQPAEVLPLLQTAIRANPDEATLALALGDHLQRSGNTQQAIDAYQAALDMFELYSLSNSLNPGRSDASRAYAYIHLAAVSEELGQLEPAMNYYSAAVAASPDLPWTQVLYGDALRRRNERLAAERAYRAAIEDDPTFANAYARLADLLFAEGKTPEATVLQRQALAAALVQTEEVAFVTAPTVGGLGAQPGEIEKSFNSDVLDSEILNLDIDMQTMLDDLVAGMAASGDQIFAADEGATVLNLVTRLGQSSGRASEVIDLYTEAVSEGEEAGWYPVILAQYYKGLGDLYLSRNQPEQAHEAYQQATTLDSWWPQAHLGLYRSLESLGEAEAALQQLQEAVEIAPGFVEAQVALAQAYEARGQDVDALAVYEQTALNHPGNPRATMALARALQARHAWARAEHYYRSTLDANAGYADAYVELAALLMAQDRYEEARPLLQQALDTDVENVNAYIQLATWEQRAGDQDEAMAWFRRAFRLAENSPSTQLVLIDLLQRFGRYETSLSFTREALRNDQDNADLLVRESQSERLLGRYTEAMLTLLDAAQHEVLDSRLSAELAELYVEQGRPEAAIAAYRQAIALTPGETIYYVRLAELLQVRGEFTQAKSVLRTGVQRALQPAPIFAAMVDLYVGLGEADEADALLSDALEQYGASSTLLLAHGSYLQTISRQNQVAQDTTESWYHTQLAERPEDPALHNALGDLYVALERSEDAIAAYEEALAYEPSNAVHYLDLASVLQTVGRVDEAEKNYAKALVLEPTLLDVYRGLAALYTSQNRWVEAEALFQKGRAMAPMDGQFYMDYCSFLLDYGETERAVAQLEQSNQLIQTAAMLRSRAQLYLRLRRFDEAQSDLQHALGKEPGSLETIIALGDLFRERSDTNNARIMYARAAQTWPGLSIGRERLTRLTR